MIHVCRAKRLGVAELVVAQIAGDDRVCSGQPGALHDVEPDAAASDDEHAGSCRHSGVTDNGTNAGRDAAPDDRGVGVWQILADLDDLLGRADDLLRECADARHLIDRLPVQPHACRTVMHPPARRIVVANAQHGLPRRAVSAAATMRPE